MNKQAAAIGFGSLLAAGVIGGSVAAVTMGGSSSPTVVQSADATSTTSTTTTTAPAPTTTTTAGVAQVQPPSQIATTTTTEAAPVTTTTRPNVTVPDVHAETPQTASATLAAAGLQSTTAGTGNEVRTQSPAAGTSVPQGTVVTLELWDANPG